jgi:hypothetical protein
VNAPAPTRNGTAPAAEAAPALRVIPMDELLSLLDLRQPERYAVEVPEWGAIFYVRGLSRQEALQFNRLSTNQKTGVQDSAKADQLQFCRCVLEPRVTPEQYDVLRERPDAAPVLQRIQSKISALTSGEPATDAAGGEVDAVTAAEFLPRRAPR